MSAAPAGEGAAPPTFDDILGAARRLAGIARVTPLLESEGLNRLAGRRVLVKAECAQVTGSFKFRGAWNRISQLTDAERANGVLAWSSGNHAQGVGAAAARAGISAKIVMPADAPVLKIERTRGYGAEVILYDRHGEDREAIGRALATDESRTIVPPYDDPRIIAGQGTCGSELASQCAALGVRPDAVIAPCSGGGLGSGVALALEQKLPGVPVYVAEPADYDDTTRSLAAGEIKTNPGGLPPSICDALLSREPGALTFSVMHGRLGGGYGVTDAEAAAAMRAAFTELKIVLEPGGATALAAVLSGKADPAFATVVVIGSGGNVDPALFAQVLREEI